MKTILTSFLMLYVFNANTQIKPTDACADTMKFVSETVKAFGNVVIQKKNGQYRWDSEVSFDSKGQMIYRKKVYFNNVYSSQSVYTIPWKQLDKRKITIEVTRENNITIEFNSKDKAEIITENTVVGGLPPIENHHSWFKIGLTKQSFDDDKPNQIKNAIIFLLDNCNSK